MKQHNQKGSPSPENPTGEEPFYSILIIGLQFKRDISAYFVCNHIKNYIVITSD